jgi:hypothetical protein
LEAKKAPPIKLRGWRSKKAPPIKVGGWRLEARAKADKRGKMRALTFLP